MFLNTVPRSASSGDGQTDLIQQILAGCSPQNFSTPAMAVKAPCQKDLCSLPDLTHHGQPKNNHQTRETMYALSKVLKQGMALRARVVYTHHVDLKYCHLGARKKKILYGVEKFRACRHDGVCWNSSPYRSVLLPAYLLVRARPSYRSTAPLLGTYRHILDIIVISLAPSSSCSESSIFKYSLCSRPEIFKSGTPKPIGGPGLRANQVPLH